jgi:hypothetical protein
MLESRPAAIAAGVAKQADAQDLKSYLGGVQVVDDMGNPLVIVGDSKFDPFSSVRFSLLLI